MLGCMYEIQIEHEFCAAHSLTISGVAEPNHGHNFCVKAVLAGEELDADGLLCDFHTAHAVLVEICEPFDNQDLNAVAPFDLVNPSAEHIARHIATELQRRLGDALAPVAWVQSVAVTEAAGCVATYRPR